MLVLKALHILSMVTMVTIFIGVEAFYASAIWRRDIGALAFVQRTVERLGFGWLSLGGLLLGIIFGILTALNGGFDLTGGWLIAAYVAVAAFFVNAAVSGAPVVQAGRRAVEVVDDPVAADELARVLPVNRAVFIVAFNAVLFAAVILDMVLKPF